jgi:Protein of unknown function (DUF3306)
VSGGRFLERWSRLKKAAEKASTAEITDAESLLANLTPDSDFGQFLRQEVSEEIRRKALKTLFADPQFNVMDGLDIYIDDYSISEPIPPEMLASLNQAKILFETPDVEDAPEQTTSEFREASPDDVQEIVAATPADLPSENNQ